MIYRIGDRIVVNKGVYKGKEGLVISTDIEPLGDQRLIIATSANTSHSFSVLNTEVRRKRTSWNQPRFFQK